MLDLQNFGHMTTSTSFFKKQLQHFVYYDYILATDLSRLRIMAIFGVFRINHSFESSYH